MKEVQDHYFREAKREGYLSRAAYKLIEIDDRRKVIARGDRVLDLGSAPGSWLQVASQRIGERGTVVGVDLKRIRLSLANVHVLEGDFTTMADDDFLAPLGRADEDAPARFDVVISDMAPDTTGDPRGDHFRSARLCESVLDRLPGLLRPGGNLVMKIFEGERYPEVLERVRAGFEHAKGFKPKASRSESVEMFLVAQGYRAPEPPAESGDDRADSADLPSRRRSRPAPGWGG